MNQILLTHLQQQIISTDNRLKRFTHTHDGKPFPHRFIFDKISKYVKDFLAKKSTSKMIIIPGFRGVGKTTLIAQICAEFKNQIENILFISVEDVRNLFDVGINEIIFAYEEILGENLENVQKPILLVFDEVQSDPKWAISLKSIFERTSNVFFCCSGSSAVSLQSTTDLARRAVFEKMPPMSFSEYQMTKNGIHPPKDLKDQIKKAIYFADNVQDSYQNLVQLKSPVNQYWSKVNRLEVSKYLAYGTLPFSFNMPSEFAIYDSISLLLDKIISQDLPTLGKFDIKTLSQVKRILFTIAENDTTSLVNLEQKINFPK